MASTPTLKIWNTYLSPATNALLDIGSLSLQFKNIYIDGLAYIDGFGEDTDMGDFDIHSIDGLYGYDDNVFIDMGVDGRIVMQADGAGTPFATPDIDITGSVFFDDDIGLSTDKKILFRDTGLGIYSQADTYMDIFADGGIRIGDSSGGAPTNYTEIKADGEIIRHGTARTTNALWLDAGGLKAPGAHPATYISHGLVGAWQFANQGVAGNQEQASANMRIPHRTDRTVAPELIIGWSSSGVSPGNCEWQLEYVWRAPNEDTTASAQETLTQISAASATSNGVVMTTFTGIDLPSATDGGIYFRLTRLSAGANDTIAGTVEALGVILKFTSDKFGTAL